PLAVSFSAANSIGTITDYLWDFGDGTTDQGPDHVQVSHTYTTPGAYTATLTINGAAGATRVIIVTKPVVAATALKGKVTLNFRSVPDFPDDLFQFTLRAPDLIRPKTDLPLLTVSTYRIRAGGSVDGTMPTTKVATATLDSHGMARTLSMNFKLNLQ